MRRASAVVPQVPLWAGRGHNGQRPRSGGGQLLQKQALADPDGRGKMDVVRVYERVKKRRV